MVDAGMPRVGTYRLIDRIGSGSTGEVWSAQAAHGGPPVAIKLLDPGLMQDQDAVARFLQERAILTGLRSPHLVRVHDLVVDDGALAIVMDLVDGTDLRAHAARVGTLPPAVAAELAGQVLGALAVVHRTGIVHRDVKPENILVRLGPDRPRALLTDFGVARIVEDPAENGVGGPIGTVSYAAPEVCLHGRSSVASDLYAVGVVLYELLAGRPPFEGRDPDEIVRAHQEDAPPPIPGLPPAIEAELTRLLAKEPGARPASATAAQQALLRAARTAPAAPALAARPARGGYSGPTVPPGPTPAMGMPSPAAVSPAMDTPPAGTARPATVSGVPRRVPGQQRLVAAALGPLDRAASAAAFASGAAAFRAGAAAATGQLALRVARPVVEPVVGPAAPAPPDPSPPVGPPEVGPPPVRDPEVRAPQVRDLEVRAPEVRALAVRHPAPAPVTASVPLVAPTAPPGRGRTTSIPLIAAPAPAPATAASGLPLLGAAARASDPSPATGAAPAGAAPVGAVPAGTAPLRAAPAAVVATTHGVDLLAPSSPGVAAEPVARTVRVGPAGSAAIAAPGGTAPKNWWVASQQAAAAPPAPAARPVPGPGSRAGHDAEHGTRPGAGYGLPEGIDPLTPTNPPTHVFTPADEPPAPTWSTGSVGVVLPPEPESSSRWWLVLVPLGVLVVAVTIAVALVLGGFGKDPGSGPMPAPTPSASVVQQPVAASTPGPTVAPSRTPAALVVPALVGAPATAAAARLSERGLRASVALTCRRGARPGRVLAQEPAAGASAERGDRVTLRAQPQDCVLVPDLRGRTINQARDALLRAGFGQVQVVSPPGTDWNHGRVTDQTPSPGPRRLSDRAGVVSDGRGPRT